jgi:hypothetical protein
LQVFGANNSIRTTQTQTIMNNPDKSQITIRLTVSSFLLWALTGIGLPAQAQRFISGYVKDKESGEPLIGATVYIPEMNNGVATNSSGFYVIKLTDNYSLKMIASFIGYRTETKEILPDRDISIDFSLTKGLELEEIKVKAPMVTENRFGSNVMEIPANELKTLPSLGGQTDLVRSYQFLPGVQGGTEGKAGMYVRGGSDDQNLVLLDGFPLYYVNHLGGFTSLFDPEAVKNFRLFKSGFPARYGNRLSSVLDVSLKEGDKFKRRNTLTLGLISGSLSSEGPAFKGKGSYFVSLRRMWIDFLTRPASFLVLDKNSIGYNFYDFNSKITVQPNHSDRFFFSLFSGDDNLILDSRDKLITPDIRSYQRNRWGNFLTATRWEHTFSLQVLLNTRLSFTKYRFLDKDYYRNKPVKTGYENAFRSRIRDFGWNNDLDFYLSNHWQVKAGTGLVLHLFEPGNSKMRNYAEGRIFSEKTFSNLTPVWESSLYIENPVSLNKLNFNAGIRLAGFFLKNKTFMYPEPRFSASLELFKNIRLKTSYAVMHQLFHMFENQVAGFGTEFFFPSTASIAPSSSRIVTIGLEKETGDVQAGIDFYLKKMGNLVCMKEGESFQGNAIDWQRRVEKGTGGAKGMELFLRKKAGNLTGWISYSLAKADRQFTGINDDKPFPYQFDRRHSLNLVASCKLSEKWSFAADWVYGSGYPITLAIGKQTVLTPGAYSDKLTDLYGTYSFGEYYGSRNGFRMKDYHRLDVGFTRSKVKRGTERIWNFSIYNLYNRQNPYYYFYKELKPWQGDRTTELYQASFIPIMPSVSYTLKF